MRAARAATSPALLGASQARRSLPGRAFAEPAVVFAPQAHRWWLSRQALSAGGDFWGDEKRSAGVGARQRAS